MRSPLEILHVREKIILKCSEYFGEVSCENVNWFERALNNIQSGDA
jgi:hypothetical protein